MHVQRDSRYLVTGGSGQLGSAFRPLLPTSFFPSRKELDLSASGSLARAIETISPDGIINCAAYTAVDRAEAEPDLAQIINVESVGKLAGAAADLGIPFVTFSTDYVFDGRKEAAYVESDEPNPLNVYGRTKLDGERRALELNPEALVIRTSWVISHTHRNFVTAMLENAQRATLRVVSDQHGRPTLADDLAIATLEALDAGLTSLVHLTNSGVPTTWHDLAKSTLQFAGLPEERIQPCSTTEYGAVAARPANSMLETERGPAVPTMPDWTDGLERLVTVQWQRIQALSVRE